MTSLTTDSPVAAVLERLDDVRDRGGGNYSARCPAHEDRHASLTVGTGDDGRALLSCHAGCSAADVCAAIGLTLADLFPPRERHDGNGRAKPNGTPAPKPRKTHATFEAAAKAGEFVSRGKYVACWRYRDADAVEYARVARFDLPGGGKSFLPFAVVPGGWQLRDPGHWDLYRLPELLNAAEDDPDAPVFVTEGEKACDAAAAAGLVSVTSAHGAKAARKTDWRSLAGRYAVVLPDNDDAGAAYAAEVAGILATLEPPARVKVVGLPGLPEGGDYVEFAAAGGTAADVLRLAEAAPWREQPPGATDGNPAVGTSGGPPSAGPDPDKPRVVLDTDEHRVVDEVVRAMADDDEIYTRGPHLARVVTGGDRREDGVLRPPSAPTIIPAALPWVRERVTRHVELMRATERGEQKAHPPLWLVPAFAARGEWPGLRELSALSESPVLRPDGTVHQAAGYDRATGVLFLPSAAFPPVPPAPTRDDAVAAVARLGEVVCDFRFETPAHRSAWLSQLLTPPARHAYGGPTPCFLVDANVAGAGKTKLCHAAAVVNTGHELPICGYAHEASEMAKRLTTIAIAGDPVILMDNIAGAFGNDALDRALTSTRWKDRKLGLNENVDLPWLTTIYATGNNVAIAADTARRVIHVRMDVLEEKPEERTGFRHRDLLEWVRRNRPRLLVDVLTALSAYCRAGRPEQGLTPFGSFEGWSGLVRSAVVWCGLPDPCETRAGLTQTADTTAGLMGQLTRAWERYDPHAAGVVVAELVARLYPPHLPPTNPEAVAMRAALENLVGCPPGKAPSVRQVGNRLKSFRRRVMDGRYLDIDPGRHDSAGAVWRLFSSKNGGAGDSGESGESFSNPFA